MFSAALKICLVITLNFYSIVELKIERINFMTKIEGIQRALA